MSIRVLSAGPHMLLQDAGRPGHAALGVSPSGALDTDAFRTGNLLVGNPAGAGVIEILMGPSSFEFQTHSVFALTGAVGVAALNGVPVPFNTAMEAPAGSVLTVGPAESGLRYYLAVRGGCTGEAVLGSVSFDVLSGLGPAPLRNGDTVPVGRPARADPPDGRAPGWHGAASRKPSDARESRSSPARLPVEGTIALRLFPGPRLDWFASDAWLRLIGAQWTVSADSNRVGLRLDGQPIARIRGGELPSEGMVTGAVQVPPSGLPTIFLADHPVTGGYPVIAVVHSADLYLLAQARPGQQLRFLTENGVRNREDHHARQ